MSELPNPRRYERGSQWRKWDLHVHAPGTKLGDSYARSDGALDWVQFCRAIHESEVAAIGIADYFSLDSYFEFVEKFAAAYPDDHRLFLPNLELRLPEVLNNDGQSVNLHILFRPTLTRAEATKFLMALNTETTVSSARKAVVCAELSTRAEFESATVSRTSIDRAIEHTFGKQATRQDHLLVITSAKGDGIRPGGKGSKMRKAALSDEIDKYSDAFFAAPSSRNYFLDLQRLEVQEDTPAKPIYGGCDAHTFEALRVGMGQQGLHQVASEFTWIKGDPTYQGLLQTLIEPAARVALQTVEPDHKEPYKVISKVRFSGTRDFPSEVTFNGNLNAIIGSRSSGKSALLAFIAHAIDPEGTIQAQMDASKLGRKYVGPAAGKTWADVSEVSCQVEWESGGTTQGRVIYIPQNSLYEISELPNKVTEKIAPALFRTYPDVKTGYEQAISNASAANEVIRTAVTEWFSLDDRMSKATQQIRDLGDRTAIETERDRLQGEVERIRVAAQLTDAEVTKYQEIAGSLQTKAERVAEIGRELSQLSPYVNIDPVAGTAVAVPGIVHVGVQVRPAAADIPAAFASRIEELRVAASRALETQIENTLASGGGRRFAERQALEAEGQSLRSSYADLIAKHQANEELSRVVDDHKKQIGTLAAIDRQEAARDTLGQAQAATVATILKALGERANALETLETIFNHEERELDGLTFGVEAAVADDVVERISAGFNQKRISKYILSSGNPVDYALARSGPSDFLRALQDRTLPLNKGYRAADVAGEVLTTTEDIRFSATLDGDRIGGFRRSSMTPGKQALFALTLILNESEEPWPLLIDQPEDDLDSRSIYDTIVPYLSERKRERQIIMASHNANLVIGADSEEIIVANRHGADRPNRDSRTFEYLTGSLEYSRARNDKSPSILSRCGIREHACEILDGGEQAFQKRRDKYKI